MISIIIYFSNFRRFFGRHKIKKIRVFYEVMGQSTQKTEIAKTKGISVKMLSVQRNG